MREMYRIALVALVGVAVGYAAAPPGRKPDRSPHAVAMDLVLRTQDDEIRKIEAPDRIDGTGDELWWHDTKERTWVVKRPFEPGVINSTHWFEVTYRIDGKDKRAWFVDTRAGTATRRDIKK